MDIERNVRDHVHITTVIHKSPAGAVDHSAADDDRRIAVICKTVAMKMDGIPGALIGAGARL